MSKGSKSLKHNAKMARKRAVKAARKTLYASLAGTSKKSKNQKKKIKISSNAKHAHLMSDCGNAGCKRCNPSKVVKQNGNILLGQSA